MVERKKCRTHMWKVYTTEVWKKGHAEKGRNGNAQQLIHLQNEVEGGRREWLQSGRERKGEEKEK
jgi:hypothetical protein